MSTSNAKTLAAGAAAAAAIGLLVTTTPAHAYPPAPLAPPDCYKEAAGYQFAGGEVVIHYPETDAETKFNAPRGITVDAPAETFYQNGTSMTGRVSGKIDKGGNWINLTVTRGSNYPPLLLSGAVQPDNTPAGNFTYENHDMQAWDSPTQLVCIPGAPVEDRPIPAPAAPKSATVTGGDADVFNIAHNDVPDPVNGITGAKIATLPNGTQVGLEGQCKDGWCRVNSSQIPQGYGFVEQGHLQIG
jgi:hypothetical protein